MKILIACEYSGTVRDAFAELGHDAMGCDLLPTDIPGKHYQGSVFDIINEGFDLMIAHPPCTHLSSAGQWCLQQKYADRFPNKQQQQQDAISFFMALVNAPIPRICIENPVGIMSTIYRKPNQCIDPYFFGEPQRKRTCLWLKHLPRLNGLIDVARNKKAFEPAPTYIDHVSGKKRYFTDAIAGTGKGGHERSKSFKSIAKAMAEQWG